MGVEQATFKTLNHLPNLCRGPIVCENMCWSSKPQWRTKHTRDLPPLCLPFCLGGMEAFMGRLHLNQACESVRRGDVFQIPSLTGREYSSISPNS